MKNLVKLIIVAFIISVSPESIAQRFCVIGGLNFSKMLMKDGDETYSDEWKMKPGFHAGVTAQFPKTGIFSFETGLLLSTKGFQMKDEMTYENETYKYKGVINLYYLDIPLIAKVSGNLGNIIIYGTAGPYIGIGLSGKMKTEFTHQGDTETEKENVEWGSDGEFNRLDYGLTFGAGVVVIESLLIGLSYDLGFANVAVNTSDSEKVKNRVLKISVGYKFGGKNKTTN